MAVHRREFRRIGVVVAAVNYFDDELFDWAAYSGDHLILDTTEEIALNGDKLLPETASIIFPDLPFEKYRL